MTPIRRPLFSFFGSKFSRSGRYPAPLHDTIVEPFAGSAGYSLRYPEKNVVLVEKDPIVFGVWEYIIKTPSSEIRALPLLPCGEDVDTLRVPQEARWLIGFWLNVATTRPSKTASRWVANAAHSQRWCEATREHIASAADRIRHWEVVNASYADVFDVAEKATWFVDPPYQTQGVHYKESSRKIDFAHLAAFCRSRKGQTIVCENQDADWLPFRPLYDLPSVSSRNAGRKQNTESVWLGRVE